MSTFSFIRLRMKKGHILVPMCLRMSADKHPLTPVITRLCKDPILRTEENPIFSSVCGSDEHGHTVRVHPIPHWGERRKDRAVPAQCAGTALSAAG